MSMEKLALKGLITELTEEQRKEYEQVKSGIEEIMKNKDKRIACLALTIIGLEITEGK